MSTFTSEQSTSRNKAVIKRWFQELSNGNFAVVDELTTSDLIFDHAPMGKLIGAEQVHQVLVPIFRDSFPGLQIFAEDMIAENDKVTARYACRGTHRGEFSGIPPTGKEVYFTGIGYYQLRDGKIAHAWVHADLMGLLQQLGSASPTT